MAQDSFSAQTDNHVVHSSEADDKINKKKKRSNLIYKIFSVASAFLIWFYVIGYESAVFERVFTSVQVTPENMNVMESQYNYSLIKGYDSYVNVQVSGKKSDINKLKDSDIFAYIDLAQVTEPGESSLPILVKPINESINVTVDPTNVLVYADKKATKNFTVTVDILTSMVNQGYFIDAPVVNPGEVAVNGPEEIIRSIDSVKVILKLGSVTKSISVKESIRLYDKDGNEINNPYLKISPSEVNIDIPLRMTKEIPLSVRYKYGYFDNSNVETVISPASIMVKGDPERLEDIDELIIDEIDEKKIDNDVEKTVNLNLPEGIVSVDGVYNAAINIDLLNNESKVLTITNFTVKSPPQGLNYTIDEKQLVIKFRGPTRELSRLNVMNIRATVDLSKYSEKVAYATVPVEITLSDYADVVYSVGDYTVTVRIE